MEYWSVEKKDINPFVFSPVLQYSNTPKLNEKEWSTSKNLWKSVKIRVLNFQKI
jgi:hypothetical protein